MKSTTCAMILLSFVAAAALAHDEHDGAKVAVLAQTTKSWDGSELPKYPAGRPEVTILRITIPPKTRLPLHKHAVINAGVLLKGRLTVVSEDGKKLELKAGDSIVELVNKWHYGRNDADEPAEIIVFYAGVEGKAITQNEAQNSEN